ncbi:hypothetical protein DFJ74DRAFT_658816 [Hyaloraphidium curvatum]|nr:hypothetical protein DFJ74DRAFT_658816 [Hyaloraphidium curvatum]
MRRTRGSRDSRRCCPPVRASTSRTSYSLPGTRPTPRRTPCPRRGCRRAPHGTRTPRCTSPGRRRSRGQRRMGGRCASWPRCSSSACASAQRTSRPPRTHAGAPMRRRGRGCWRWRRGSGQRGRPRISRFSWGGMPRWRGRMRMGCLRRG